MDGQKPVEPPASTDEPAKQPRRSFMDIRHAKPDAAAPIASDKNPDASSPQQPEPKPLSEKATETPQIALPPEETNEKPDDPAAKLDEPKKGKTPKLPKPPKPPKQPRQPGVGLAIFATIIIILGLGLLATYAYLRSNNISVF